MSDLVKSFAEKLSKLEVRYVGAYLDIGRSPSEINYVEVKGEKKIAVAMSCKTIILLTNQDQVGFPFEYSYGLGFLKDSMEIKKDRMKSLEKKESPIGYVTITPNGYIPIRNRAYVHASEKLDGKKVPLVTKEELVISLINDYLYSHDENLDDENVELASLIRGNIRKLSCITGFNFGYPFCSLLMYGPNNDGTFDSENPYFMSMMKKNQV